MTKRVSCQCPPVVGGAPSVTSSGERERLPQRDIASAAATTLWSVEGAVTSSPSRTTCQHLLDSDSLTDDLLHKCDATTPATLCSPHGDEKNRDTCCRDQVEPERNLISHDLVRDIIIGLSDGLMVPFALTAGLSSLGSSKLVYQGGFAELVSGAISMGIGGYLSAKGEQDIFRHRFTAISNKLSVACPSETHRSVHDVLGPFGVKPGISKLVAESLEMVQRDMDEKEGMTLKPDQAQGIEAGTVARPPSKPSLRARLGLVQKPKVPSCGTSAFLIKLGEGMDEVPSRRLFISAFTIGISYFLGGLIPIIPYLCVADALHGLYWSILATGIILLIFGVAKSWFTGAATGLLGLLWGAISTLAVGAAAAAASYGVVKALETRGS